MVVLAVVALVVVATLLAATLWLGMVVEAQRHPPAPRQMPRPYRMPVGASAIDMRRTANGRWVAD